MGCFDVGCFLSRMSIHHGDDCLLVPVMANDDSDTFGTTAHYRPFCLPIRGKYNDYGRIEEIVHDRNTAAIEAYFRMGIDQFVEIITLRGGMYEWSPIQAVYGVRKLHVDQESLAAIGFVFDGDTVAHEAFNFDGHGVTMRWDGTAFTVSAPEYEKSFSFGSDDGWKLLERLATIRERAVSKLPFAMRWYHETPYYFGIPKAKHKLVELLLGMKAAFAHYGIYHALGQKAWRMRVTTDKRRTAWASEAEARYAVAVTDYLDAKARCDEWGAIPLEERHVRPDFESQNTETVIFHMNSEHGDLWRGKLEPFRAGKNLKGREFLDLYGRLLLDAEIGEMLSAWERVELAMYIGNMYLMPYRSHEQYGDEAEQCALAAAILSGIRAVRKARSTH
jgi:hypothetical protein